MTPCQPLRANARNQIKHVGGYYGLLKRKFAGLSHRVSLFLLTCFFISGLGISKVSAINPGDVSITNKSGPYFILDNDAPCTTGPDAGYVAYQICNTSGSTLTDLTAELGGMNSYYSLSGGQAVAQDVGTLDAGECKMMFWHVGMSCTVMIPTDITITVADASPGTVNATNSVNTTVAFQNGGTGGKVVSTIPGPEMAADGTVWVDVTYQYKNVPKNGTIYFQPVGNADFAADCFQLTRFEVISSDIEFVIPVGEGESFYYVLPQKTGGGTHDVLVRFYFKANCPDFITAIWPYTSAKSGNKLKYSIQHSALFVNVPNDFSIPCDAIPGDDFKMIGTGPDASGDNWGGSWGDYDSDGYPDLFVVTQNVNQPNELYHNNGDGTFTKVTSGAIVTDKASSIAASWADYDNDGDLDLYVGNNIGFNNFLYRNDGNGSFVSIQNDPIVNYSEYSHGVSWGDYDNDGFLDMFVATYWETAFNRLYHNNGDGTFSEVTNNPVVNEASRSVMGTWGDYDNDGFLDLFVVNLNDNPNSLYQNIGNGDFKKVQKGEIVEDIGWSVGASWGDYDNDGFLDLFVANASDEANFLYQNNGNSTFTKITEGDIVTELGHTHGSSWADYDNDGDLDLFVANDGQDNVLYENNDDGTFSKVVDEILAQGGLSFGSAWADFDQDGDQDLFVANRMGEENFLYQNEKWNCNNWVNLHLKGTNTNASAIGAKVTVWAEINGEFKPQMREVSTQSGGGTGSQNEMALHFGLGDADIIDLITVKWPSGFEQTLTSQQVNQQIEITEIDGSEISGFIYYQENLVCESALPAGAENADYRTTGGGDWDSNSTWMGGNVPPDDVSNKTISIEHDVTIEDENLKLENSTIWVTGATLTIEKGNFEAKHSEFFLQDAELLVEDGNADFKESDDVFQAEQSKIVVDNNFTSKGSSLLSGVCMEVGGNLKFYNTGDMTNVIAVVEGDFQNDKGDIVATNAKFRVDGNFQNKSSSSFSGQGLTIWLEDGNLKNDGAWTAEVDQYCVDGSVQGINNSYLPASEVCSGMDNIFTAAACSGMMAQGGSGTVEEQIGIPNAKVVLQPGNITVYTDESGYYSANVPTGTYTVEVEPGENWETICPNENGIAVVSVENIGQEYPAYDFGHDALCTLPDMDVEVAVTAHRIGEENLMVVNYENLGVTEANNVVLTLSLGDKITALESTIPWEGYAPTVLIWNFPTLAPGEQGAIYITYTVNQSAAPGESLVVSANLTCSENDCNVLNDSFVLTADALSGFDPNDILVNPEGGIHQDQTLNYKIRFQNVGNANVSTVRIEDRLPEELDLSTLEIGAASHTYSFRAENNKLIWEFPNINLPDSISNEPGSHGFVTFKIKPKSGLTVGDKILNQASIYFDNLSPVHTNTVTNFILSEENGKPGKANVLNIFPNPVSGSGLVTVQFRELELLGNDVSLQTVEVYGPLGQLVLRQHQETDYRMQLDLGDQLPGLFTVKGVDNQGRVYNGKFLVVD